MRVDIIVNSLFTLGLISAIAMLAFAILGLWVFATISLSVLFLSFFVSLGIMMWSD